MGGKGCESVLCKWLTEMGLCSILSMTERMRQVNAVYEEELLMSFISKDGVGDCCKRHGVWG